MSLNYEDMIVLMFRLLRDIPYGTRPVLLCPLHDNRDVYNYDKAYLFSSKVTLRVYLSMVHPEEHIFLTEFGIKFDIIFIKIS